MRSSKNDIPVEMTLSPAEDVPGLSVRGNMNGQKDQAEDRMAYMADLLSELRDMARAEGRTTLAGLLALAQAEALRKGH